MINGCISTMKTKPSYKGMLSTLKSVIYRGVIPNEFYIVDNDKKKRWNYLKGSKAEPRETKSGFKYDFKEGAMIFPDSLEKPSRTIITGEGGPSPSRFKHVIKTKKGLRRLIPIELERLNMFPDNHTEFKNVTDNKRAFLMGNALVIGGCRKAGKNFKKEIGK